jgi:hypothetical protein
MTIFCFLIIVIYAGNFNKNKVFTFKWCKNYTIGNFTNR